MQYKLNISLITKVMSKIFLHKIEKSFELPDRVHFSLSFPSHQRVFLCPSFSPRFPQRRFLCVNENEMSFTVGGIRSRTGSGNQTKLNSRL